MVIYLFVFFFGCFSLSVNQLNDLCDFLACRHSAVFGAGALNSDPADCGQITNNALFYSQASL